MTKIKEKLRRGEPVFLVRMAFNSPRLVEFIAQFDFDAVLIDCEHTSASVSCVEDMARAARASGIAAIVRPEMLNESIVTRYLDCRADGIMAPHIDDANAARMLCSIVKYARPQTYQDLTLIAMLESEQAIANLDDILAVEGIDSFFLARVDLSKSMGLGGDKKNATVRKVVDDAVARICAKGLIAGAAGDMDNVTSVIAQGARLIFITVEDMVRHGCEAYLEAAHRRVP